MRTHWTRLLHVDLLGTGTGSNAPRHITRPTVATHRRTDDLASALQSTAHTAWRAMRSVATAYAHRRRIRALRAELRSLDDDVLRDLAIYRSEIESVVAEITGEATPTRRQAPGAARDAAPMQVF